MREAVMALRLSPAMVLVDGRDDPGIESVVRTIVGGDGISLSIAAASVLAKVTRDRIMAELAFQYPVYGFERHVGYATEYHRRAIRLHGPATPHRMSFLGSILQKRLPL
jgi:ribonuclease HII